MRTIPIHQSLHRHAHVFGAERELVMTAGLVALLVGIGGLTVLSGLSAVAFWLIAVFALRRMAKADPIMSRVWLRHIRQQDFYPAKAKRWREGGFRC
ncbi:MAG: conjugal transfer protein TrbD [Desulfovibrionaceae bacterium]|nr:conjugal transfer protein TrbD [Desulfovibrionaceae bacterium]